MPCKQSRPHGDTTRGFTLIELLVAVALLGLILTLLFGGFSQLSRTSRELNEDGEGRRELRLLARMVLDELTAVQYLAIHATANGPSGLTGDLEVIGTDTYSRVDFHAAVMARFHRQVDPQGDPGIHELGYRVMLDDDRETRLLVRREDFFADRDLSAGGDQTPLARNVETFTVEYLSTVASSESLEDWSTQWDTETRVSAGQPPLPTAIRVTLALRQDDGNLLEETLVRNLTSMLNISKAADP